MSKNLSKSRYTAYCQCPKNLWLGVYRPDLNEVDASLQARFDRGTEVGNLAKQLFDGVVDITTHDGDRLDLAAMIEKTLSCLADGTPVIAEAAFSYEGCYCAVDLLRHEGDGWAIYEVKSSSGEEEGDDDKVEKYAPDIAYQKWVLTQCGINVTGTYLVCLNRNYVRHGELDIQQLFAVVDMEELVSNELLKVPMQVKAALQVLAQDEEPETDLTENCQKPYSCAFFDYCKKQHGIPEDGTTVFDLYRMSFGKKLEHYHAGRITFEDIRDERLSDKQQMQVECTLGQKECIDRDGIREFLEGLSYPLYFLDFETMQDAVPQYDGTRPYQQITFQYSLHIKRNADAPYEHREYLAQSDGRDPRRLLAEQLCRDIPKNVCTLAYNMGFEKGRIKELAEMYPDLADHLLNIRDHIQDLLVPFQQGCYYVPAMKGSFSIKSVLPALFPGAPELDYHNLAGSVHNGGEAMTIFPLIKDMPPAEAEAARQSLLRYCELDTWAMVKVWEKLKEVSK